MTTENGKPEKPLADMTLPEWSVAVAAEGERESSALAITIAKLHNRWAMLEHEHCLILHCALFGTKTESPSVSAAIYFTAQAADVRFGIVDRVIEDRLIHLDQENRVAGERMQQCWTQIMKKRDKKRRARNTVAHSMIAIHRKHDHSPCARLVKVPSNPKGSFSKPVLLPGLSASDVNVSSDGIAKVLEYVKMMHDILKALLHKDALTLQKKLLSLELMLGVLKFQGGNLIRSGTEPQQQPSPEKSQGESSPPDS